MLGLGLSIPQVATLGTGGGPSNLLPISADAFWVRTPSPWGTALAHHIVRNNYTAASSNGAPSECWRRIGTVEIATVASDPTSPLFSYYAGTGGALDYALMRSGGTYGGSFHGGETAMAMALLGDGRVLDHTQAASFSTFKIARPGGQGRQSTITWPDATTMSVEFLLSINSDGTIEETGSLTSTAAFATQYIGIDAFDYPSFGQRITSQGTVNTASDSDISSGDGDVTYRAGATGHTARIQSNIPSATRYQKTTTDNQTTQVKHYPTLASTSGGAFGTVSWSRTITFGKGEPDPPVVLHWQGSVDGATGYTTIQNGTQYSFASNKIVLTRSGAASGAARVLFAMTGLSVGQQYSVPTVLEVTGGSPSAGTTVVVSVNSNGASGTQIGTASSGTPSFTFTATASTMYFYFNQTGTTGSDNVLRIAEIGPVTAA